METESRIVVARGWGWGGGWEATELLFNGRKFYLQDEDLWR